MMQGVERNNERHQSPQQQGRAASGGTHPTPDPAMKEYFDLAHQFRHSMSRPCTPHFVGVWDTVSSIGLIDNPLHLPYTANNEDIAIGRHAIAIDERRAFYRSNLWHPGSDPTHAGPLCLKQVWFAGVHCDVGGGYAESESALSKIPLEWMLKEAKEADLLVDPARVDLVLGRAGHGYVAPDATAEPHESLTKAWELAEYVPKQHWVLDAASQQWRLEWRCNRGRPRTIPKASLVHKSVLQRDETYRAKLPPDVRYVD
jgi:uncharacterized protein (DUF2235 family)